MQMGNGLPCGGAVIDADVEALRLKLFVQCQLSTVKQRKQVDALMFR